jgi:hypothetical protein
MIKKVKKKITKNKKTKSNSAPIKKKKKILNYLTFQ